MTGDPSSESGEAAGLFVAGTDTGVGKTLVTAGLTAWLREEGVDATAVKPTQTGAPEDDDARFVADVCRETEAVIRGEADAAVCHRRLGPALAPRVAAEIEGVDLEYDEILADCRETVESSEAAVVEGIGGLRVPLAGDREVLDLAADLGLPAIVVSRSGLGTLNHTALTVDALRDRGLDVRAVLLNQYEGADVAERTNPEELQRMLDLPVATLEPLDAEDHEAIVEGVREALPRSAVPGLRE